MQNWLDGGPVSGVVKWLELKVRADVVDAPRESSLFGGEHGGRHKERSRKYAQGVE
jgi:hypothetical protein